MGRTSLPRFRSPSPNPFMPSPSSEQFHSPWSSLPVKRPSLLVQLASPGKIPVSVTYVSAFSPHHFPYCPSHRRSPSQFHLQMNSVLTLSTATSTASQSASLLTSVEVAAGLWAYTYLTPLVVTFLILDHQAILVGESRDLQSLST